MPTEDFRVTQNISVATSVLGKVKGYTYGPSELLHTPTTYGRKASKGAKKWIKLCSFEAL